MAYSKSIRSAIERVMDACNIKREFIEEKGAFHFGFDCEIKNIKSLNLFIVVGENHFSTFCTIPLKADYEDQDALRAMAECICRANYGLTFGHFNLDARDGEIQYQVSVNCAGIDEPSDDMIQRAIFLPIAMFNRYGGGIVDVMFGGATPEDAAAKCDAE